MAKIRELRGLIYDRYDTETELAAELGWPKQRLNVITNGNREPSLREVEALATKLGTSVEEMVYIFLRAKSTNGQQARAI